MWGDTTLAKFGETLYDVQKKRFCLVPILLELLESNPILSSNYHELILSMSKI